jgi:hypothetical protein
MPSRAQYGATAPHQRRYSRCCCAAPFNGQVPLGAEEEAAKVLEAEADDSLALAVDLKEDVAGADVLAVLGRAAGGEGGDGAAAGLAGGEFGFQDSGVVAFTILAFMCAEGATKVTEPS